MTVHLFICVHYVVSTVYLHDALHWRSFYSFRDSIFIQIYLSNCFIIDYIADYLCHYFHTGMNSRYFDPAHQQPVTTSSSKLINITWYKFCAWFHFSLGSLKAYSNHNRETRIYWTNFSELGRGGRDNIQYTQYIYSLVCRQVNTGNQVNKFGQTEKLQQCLVL